MAMWRESDALIHWNWGSINFPNSKSNESKVIIENLLIPWKFVRDISFSHLKTLSTTFPRRLSPSECPHKPPKEIVCPSGTNSSAVGILNPSPMAEASCWTVDVLGMVMPQPINEGFEWENWWKLSITFNKQMTHNLPCLTVPECIGNCTE